MDDSISRQAAIDVIFADKIVGNALLIMKAIGESDKALTLNSACDRHIRAIEQLPSVQPERLPDDDFETIRIHLSAFKEQLCNQHRWKEAEEYQRIIDRFMSFANAQPEIIHCKDCKHSEHWYRDKARCFLWHEQGIDVFEDGYCSYAERKEGDTDG